jgi:hypothetical protein
MNSQAAWSEDYEHVLENLRINCIIFSNYHKNKYYKYKSYLKYFKLPLIVLSSITSIASVGLTKFVSQSKVSVITCILSLISAIIASVELYLGIQKSMETELLSSKEFLVIAYDIYKVLNLERKHRAVAGKVYLDEKFQEYKKLVENAKLIHSKKILDNLAPLPIHCNISETTSNSPNNKNNIEIDNNINI